MLYVGAGTPKHPGIYEMPPMPPDGIFDARYASQRITEFVEDEKPKEFPILLTSAVYPVTMRSDLQSFHASINIGNKDVPFSANGKIAINNQQSNIILKISKGPDVPRQFALEQNYPNPFNPTTTIRYQIADARLVTLKIYDVLGREVATLVNEIKQPGYYSLQWNGSNIGSGLYFYRLEARQTAGGQAGTFTETKKLILMK
jgi:hypothetical protein